MRQDSLDLILDSATTIDYNFSVAVLASQIVIVGLLESALPDQIAGLEAFVLVGSLLQLLGSDLSHIAKHVSQQTVRRVATLWLLFDAQFRELQLMCFNPGDVSGSSVLLHQDRFKRGLGTYLVKAVAKYVDINCECLCEWIDEGKEIATLQVFAGEDDVIDRTRVDQRMSIAIEYHSSRCGNR